MLTFALRRSGLGSPQHGLPWVGRPPTYTCNPAVYETAGLVCHKSTSTSSVCSCLGRAATAGEHGALLLRGMTFRVKVPASWCWGRLPRSCCGIRQLIIMRCSTACERPQLLLWHLERFSDCWDLRHSVQRTPLRTQCLSLAFPHPVTFTPAPVPSASHVQFSGGFRCAARRRKDGQRDSSGTGNLDQSQRCWGVLGIFQILGYISYDISY